METVKPKREKRSKKEGGQGPICTWVSTPGGPIYSTAISSRMFLTSPVHGATIHRRYNPTQVAKLECKTRQPRGGPSWNWKGVVAGAWGARAQRCGRGQNVKQVPHFTSEPLLTCLAAVHHADCGAGSFRPGQWKALCHIHHFWEDEQAVRCWLCWPPRNDLTRTSQPDAPTAGGQ